MSDFAHSITMLQNKNVLLYVGKGVLFTVFISVIAILISIILGSILAVLRNYFTKGFPGILRVAQQSGSGRRIEQNCRGKKSGKGKNLYTDRV